MVKLPLRALLLAAGLGTRLRPLTLSKPKCLVRVGDEPLLGHWLSKLEKAGCEETIVNTHYLPEQVVNYVKEWRSPNMRVSLFHEPKLLGTAGTLMANERFFNGGTGLLIHADNAMAEDLDDFLNAHENRGKGCLLTMLTFKTETPHTCGIVETNQCGVLINFHEKVTNPPGDIANGAIYAFEKSLLERIKQFECSPVDFSTEVIPRLVGRIQTWQTRNMFIDIGNPEALKRAQKIWGNKS